MNITTVTQVQTCCLHFYQCSGEQAVSVVKSQWRTTEGIIVYVQ